MDKKYLVKRRQGWYVVVRVPPSLRDAVGRAHITRSLKTRDVAEARRLRWSVVEPIKHYLESLRAKRVNGTDNTDMVERAKALRREVALGILSEDDAATQMEAWTDQWIDAKGGNPDAISVTDAAPVRLANAIAAGQPIRLLSDALEDHLRELAKTARKQTVSARQSRVEAFRAWAGGDIELKRVTKQRAGQYVTEVLARSSKAPKTLKDTISDLSAFFAWCETRGLTDRNPFYRMSGTIKHTTRGEKKTAKREEWKPEELKALLSGLERDDPLWPLVVIGLYTGMRLNEIAETETKDVHAHYIHVPKGKTESSVRDVPLHPLIRSLVAKLKKASKDGYLIPGLKRGGEDGKRGHYASKRFTRVRRALGLERPGVVFHSLRKNFATALANAGVPENIAQQIVGHKKQSMTFGLYSRGVDRKVLLKEVAKVTYGKLDAHAMSSG